MSYWAVMHINNPESCHCLSLIVPSREDSAALSCNVEDADLTAGPHNI